MKQYFSASHHSIVHSASNGRSAFLVGEAYRALSAMRMSIYDIMYRITHPIIDHIEDV